MAFVAFDKLRRYSYGVIDISYEIL